MTLALTAGVPTACLVAAGWAMGVAGWLTLTLAVLVFVLVGSTGLFLILRIEHNPPAPHKIDPADGQGAGDRADLHQS